MEAAHHPWPALGALLLRDGLVDKSELESVLSLQEDSGHRRLSARRLGEILVERGTVTHAQVAQLVAEQYELPYLELAETDVNLRAASLLSEDLAREYAALPISVLPDGSVLVATADPPLVLFSDDFRKLLGVPLRYAVTPHDELDAAIAYAVARALEPGASVEEVADDMAEADERSPAGVAHDAEATFVVPEHPRAHRSAAIGALLVRDGLVTEDELDAALAQQRIAGSKRLGEILVERGVVTRSQVARLVAEQYDLPYLEIELGLLQLEAARLLPEVVAHRLSALPLGFASDGSLLVAVSDPTNVIYADELRTALDAPIRFAVATPEEIDAATSFVHVHSHEEVVEGPWYDDVVEEADEAVPVGSLDDDLFAEVADPPREGEQLAEVVELPVDSARHEEAVFELADPPPDPVWLDDEPPPETSPLAHEADEGTYPAAEATDTKPDAAALDHELLGEAEERVSVSLVEPELDGEPGPSEAETRQAPASVGDDVPSGDGDGAVEAVADVIRHALALGASTVQLSSQPRGVVARCRVDGTLRALGGDAAQLSHAALADLAEAAGVDPWTRTPREGLLALANGEDSVALRATVLPTRLGLQVVLRVPGRHGVPSTLSELGLHSSVEASLRDALRQPSGALVVCGHALSGRTTTLYAVLHELTTADRALVTVEHPVERLVAGVDQLEPDLAAGATFAQGVRAAIRADADVLLVGDLRDEATAEVAFRGARSERVVLTSLDCPTAARAAARLARLGVDGSLAASTLTALVAQSLLRRVCPDCRETYYANAEEIAELGRPEEESGRRLLARGRGCESCSGTGYRGSVAVFEALPLTDDVRGLVAGGAPAEAIRDAALAAGMSTLRDEAVGLCLDGVTTPSEVRLVATD